MSARGLIGSGRGVLARVLSEYGMVLVLGLLCAYYSWATWGVRIAEGDDAADEVLGKLTPTSDGVLVVAHQGDEAERFARAVEGGLTKRGVKVIGIVRGEPMQLREALDRLAAQNANVGVIAATYEA